MKAILIFSLLFGATSAFADGPTCDDLGAVEYKNVTVLATNHFFDVIAVRGGIETFMSTMSLSVSDCHDYDGEFSNMQFTLTWRQAIVKNAKKVYQSCQQEINVNSSEIEYTDDIECVSDKK